jgi:perosamine synthetase
MVAAQQSDCASMIPITKPMLDEDEAKAARQVILSGWTSQGPEVASFEREFADYVRAPYACAVSSCTTALHLALLAAGVQPGDEVITVSHSYIATANVIRYCGATPVFVDIDPNTFNLDPKFIERVVTSRTRAILCVHQIGMPCDLAAILKTARHYLIPVIEDAACAIGSEIFWQGHWEKIGKPHADIACFSFHPRKVISTGDGGMITTANSEWDAKFRLLRQHGMSVPDTVRHEAGKVIFESYPVLGFNFRMTDIQAAIGRVQLKRLPDLVNKRRDLAVRYQSLLAEIPGLGLPAEPEWARSTWQSFCVRLPSGSDQRKVMQSMLDAGVATRRGVMCAHREAAYPTETWSCAGRNLGCNCAAGYCEKLRHSQEAQDQTIILPLFPQMSIEQQDHVVKALDGALCAATLD